MSTKKLITKVVLGTLAAIAVASLFLILNLNAWPVPLQQLDKVGKGMNAEQVKGLLGDPTEISPGNSKWTYSRFLSWPIVRIEFDKSGLVSSIEKDY
jgi:outer membrane protein assembly factor BamE (lipoprotein component of BamABCDE complex)